MTDSNADEKSETRPVSAAPAGGTAINRRWIIENVVSLGVALAIVFMIRSSIVEAFKIPSGSMIPTLFVGDHIFVNKFAYGLKLPFTDLFMDDPVTLIQRAPPQRGDVVVFKYPRDESIYYIKRVVGIPGDVIEVRSHDLLINGKPIAKTTVETERAKAILTELDDAKFARSSIEIFDEQLDAQKHLMMVDHDNYYNDSAGPFTVPADHLFVMGDNRDFSNDSRFWGFVPYRNVKGKAMVIWLSLWISFSEPSTSTFKPGRSGTVIH